MSRDMKSPGLACRLLPATIALLALTAGPASAACFDTLTGPAPAPAAARVPALSGRIVQAAFQSSVPGLEKKEARDNEVEPVVGLWEFQMEITGLPRDFGTQAWHDDGTELMFSAGRNPATGDVCQGVWRKIGPRTYSLNHIAMGWDFGEFGIRVRIHAVVTVDRSGDTYTGTLTADAYAVTPDAPFDESVPVFSGTGTITGTRVKPD